VGVGIGIGIGAEVEVGVGAGTDFAALVPLDGANKAGIGGLGASIAAAPGSGWTGGATLDGTNSGIGPAVEVGMGGTADDGVSVGIGAGIGSSASLISGTTPPDDDATIGKIGSGSSATLADGAGNPGFA